MEIIPLIVGLLEVNCYIVGDSKKNEWAVIDPGGDPDKIVEIIKEKDAKIKFIINTHGHPDHTAANAIIKEKTSAPIYIHRQDGKLLSTLFTSFASLTGIKGVPSKPDRLLEDGEELSLGDIKLKVIYTPGHTRGGICLFSDKILFSGDTLFAGSIGRTDLPGGSLKTLVASIKTKLFVLPDDTAVYPGHGPETTLEQEKRFNPFLS